MIVRGFHDPDAPAWVVWVTMCSSLAFVHATLVWTVVAFITVAQHPVGSVSEQCPGSILWPLLLILGLFTAALALVLLTVGISAQSGMPLPGSEWTHTRKRRVVIAGAAMWAVLWMMSGVASLSSCALDKLNAHAVRNMVLAWFIAHLIIALAAGSSMGVQRVHLWWRRRQVRLERAAYCSRQAGIEGTGAGQKVLI